MLILNAQKINIVNQGFFFFPGMYLYGGRCNSRIYSDLWYLQLKTLQWHHIPLNMNVTCFFHHAAVSQVLGFLFFFLACNIFSWDCFVIAGCAMYFSANTLSKNSATRNQLMLIENIKTCDLHRSVFDIFYFFFHILEICKVYKFMHKILGW